MSVKVSLLIDRVTEAVQRYKIEGEPGIEWVWTRLMCDNERRAFDLFLINTGDILMFAPGTPYSRFRRRVIAMATNQSANDVQ